MQKTVSNNLCKFERRKINSIAMDSKKIKRSILVSLIVMCVSFQQFTRLAGIENIKAIHAVTLLACGTALGVFLVNLMLLIKNNKDKK